MPLTETGKKVMSSMKKQYGEKKGERVFYAMENKRPEWDNRSKRGSGVFNDSELKQGYRRVN
jgi:hypothetical protein